MGNKPIILYDGYCNLCNGTLKFIAKRDKHNRLDWIPLQSEAAEKLLMSFLLKPESDTVILIDKDRYLERSDAVLETLRHLPFPWNTFASLRLIPKKMRDSVYDWIAKNRLK